MPGEPGKSAPDRFSWEGPVFTEWLDDLLDGLNLEKISLIGMSLGAWAALKYALYRPGSPPLFTDEELRSLSIPVLDLAGEKDALLNTPETAERLQKWVPNLTLNILKEEGHVVINLAPRILPFLLRSEVS